jgi:hypothetical protein
MLVLLIFAASFVQVTQAYHNSDFGFSITPPDGWQSQAVEGLVVQYIDPSVATTGASINVVIQVTSQTLAQSMPSTKSYLAGLFDNFNVISEGYIEFNGLTGYQMTFTDTMNDVEFKQQQYYFIENGRAYIITCTAFKSQFGNVAMSLVSSVNSFTIDSISITQSPSATNQPQIANSGLDSVTIIAIIAVIMISLIAITGFVLFMRRPRSINPPIQPNLSTVQSTYINTETITAPKFCRHCGAQTKTDSAYCDNCGKKLN